MEQYFIGTEMKAAFTINGDAEGTMTSPQVVTSRERRKPEVVGVRWI